MRRLLGALRHPFAGGSPAPGTTARPEFSSFEDAERAAFRASAVVPPAGTSAASAIGPAPVIDRPTAPEDDPVARASSGQPPAVTSMLDPAVRPAKPVAATRQQQAIRATAVREEDIGAANPPSTDPIPASTGPDAPAVRTKRQPGETAPESLLRAPAAAASVADDFFDGLVRRVEGDR